MKIKLLLLAFALFAVSSSAFAKKNSDESKFKVVYDDVDDVTRITHVDMELKEKDVYNLRDFTLNERENIRLTIANEFLVVYADYQHNSEWLFMDSLVFLDGNGGRLKIDNGKLRKEVKRIVNQSVVRERYMAVLERESADKLYDILNAENPTVSFIGSNYRTDKLSIKPKVKAAMIATIEKWRSMDE